MTRTMKRMGQTMSNGKLYTFGVSLVLFWVNTVCALRYLFNGTGELNLVIHLLVCVLSVVIMLFAACDCEDEVLMRLTQAKKGNHGKEEKRF